ncbi:MAG: FAD-dependent oxidoreductase [Proteobacteria bacterium]|nr:FAD-dependent oxidoreductase [Pseudomonadota bacterium]
MPHYENIPYPFKRPLELDGKSQQLYPVAIVGAGPIGLSMAIDLALHGIRSVVLDDNNVVSVGSRAICWAKRTLEIFDRLGVADRMLEKGVTWKVGRLFHGEEEVYNFDLLPDDNHKMPAFINLQQYYVEQYLVERTQDFPDLIDLRWLSKVTDEELEDEKVTVSVSTPEGNYTLDAEYVVACDGAKSSVRERLGLPFKGHTFEERFLIADVEMEQSPFPDDETHERWFWFEPPFHNGQSALLHKQPDNIYRIDLQLGPEAYPEEEAKPENVIRRIKQVVGDRKFDLDWVSVYSFTCAKLDRFIHDRIIFVGDSAHVVSPFGARGGNGGIQDVDNLGWKLAAVLKGAAEPALLESYHEERSHGSAENILHSSRATNFMTPKSKMEAIFRQEVLNMAEHLPFARKLVNSGRLSAPCSLADMALQTPATSPTSIPPGTVCPDAAVTQNGKRGWLLNHLGGEFILLTTGEAAKEYDPEGLKKLHVSASETDETDELVDVTGTIIAEFGENKIYLVRPDQHIAACFDLSEVECLPTALRRANAGSMMEAAE